MGLGSRTRGLSRAWRSGTEGLRSSRVYGLGFRVEHSGSRVVGFRVEDHGSSLRVSLSIFIQCTGTQHQTCDSALHMLQERDGEEGDEAEGDKEADYSSSESPHIIVQ